MKAQAALARFFFLRRSSARTGEGGDRHRRDPKVRPLFWKAIHAGAVKASRELGRGDLEGPARRTIATLSCGGRELREPRGLRHRPRPTDDKALRLPVTDAMRAGSPSSSSTPAR
jgi:hypothetical protein